METIQKIELVLRKDNPEFNETIVEQYWGIENNIFTKKPSIIAKQSEYTSNDISRIAKASGFLKITGTCVNCKKTRLLKAFSQTEGKRILAPLWECDNCKEDKETAKELAKNKILETRAEKFKLSINRENWTKFSKKELISILQMLEAPTVKQLINGLYKLDDKSYWVILFKANKYGLVDLVTQNGNYITGFFKPENIVELIEDYLDKIKNQSLSNSKLAHQSMSFKMMKNHRVKNSDDALYYGDVSFDRDILIKAGTLYAYSVWPKEHGDTRFYIAPSDNILKSKNRPRPNGPQIIGDIIKDWEI